VPFFSSGISFPPGIPTWRGLLEELGIASDYISDPHLDNDPLTQAELIAHDIGEDQLQAKLRKKVISVKIPTIAHYLLGSSFLPCLYND
jgi:hypothetical protein